MIITMFRSRNLGHEPIYSVLASTENHSITFNDVIQALAREYRKLGRQMPTEFKRADGDKMPHRHPYNGRW